MKRILLATLWLASHTPAADATATCPTHGWPAHLRARAGRVAWCESGCRPQVKNAEGSSATGLFQITNGTWSDFANPGEVRTNPIDNSVVAYRIYKKRGWQPWSSSRHCWGAP